MRRPVLAAALLLAGCGGGKIGDTVPAGYSKLRVTSSVFKEGDTLAAKYSCDGAGDEPAVAVGAVPAAAKELVVTVTDPDASGGTFAHLIRFGLPARDGDVSHGDHTLTNSGGSPGWTPPCPPSGTHRYIWTVYALARPSGLKQAAKPQSVNAALKTMIARGSLTARYSR
jgi:phosphatidylethanolamine-binding protein (PEBP) family uncharacterized protein